MPLRGVMAACTLAFGLACGLACPCFAQAAAERTPATAEGAALTAAQTERYRALIDEIRCLVCQNQTIADSQADLATDLKREIRSMIEAGRSDAEILDFLVERYGDFVLYKPPLQKNTLLLWVGPAVMVLLGGIVFWRVLKARSRMPEGEVPTDEA